MSRRHIAGCRALVTGASSGIGRSLALELARRGADLVVVARRRERLEELAAHVSALGRRCEIVVGDVTDQALREEAIACARQRLGGLDLLVNNAGVGAVGPFERASPERLRQVMEVNFFALAEMTRAALPLLKQGRRPMVVNLASILSHQAIPGSSEYCASKFAVRGFSQSLRAELRPLGIDVLVVSPAGTESEFWEHLVDQQGPPSFKGRATSAEVVARRIVRAIERGQHELFPTWPARLVWWGQRLAPRMLEWIVARRSGIPPSEA
jgi:short-subunit dehydrogenase